MQRRGDARRKAMAGGEAAGGRLVGWLVEARPGLACSNQPTSLPRVETRPGLTCSKTEARHVPAKGHWSSGDWAATCR